jgi:16S rRNA C967 or C1407 C5-methylase (RsmB/RsmF family)
MDWILVDTPCTGTGTMRRNSDMKWKFEESTLSRLIGQQRQIFEKALSFLHPEGRIVYGTCSLLQEEKQLQVEHFIRTYQLEQEGEVFQTLPSLNGMDVSSLAVRYQRVCQGFRPEGEVQWNHKNA